jgi:general stress protein 26
MAHDSVQAAHRLLATINHATVATVSAQGRPWNTPVYFARRGNSFYWASRSDAQHSVNIRHNRQAFIVIYDSSRDDTSGAAVYIDADVLELSDEEAIDSALDSIYQRRQKSKPCAAKFIGDSTQRVYHATARRAWTNLLHTSDDIPWDERIEIALQP